MKSHLIIIQICFLFLAICPPIISQDEDFENIFETITDDTDQSLELDLIEYFIENPINIFNTNSLHLSQIPGIDLLTALRIVEFVQIKGINSISILIDSLNLSNFQVKMLTLCTNLSPNTVEIDAEFKSRNRLTFNTGIIKGIDNGKYVGDMADYYVRNRIKFEHLELGLLLSKDPGERSLADFVSGFVNYNNKNIFVLVGDYYFDFGIGNILWHNFGMKKGAEVSGLSGLFGQGIKPYMSSIESKFLRGAAVHFRDLLLSGFEVSLFASNLNRSASIDTVEGFVSSIKTDGYFRTDLEISRKENLNEIMTGAIFNYQSGSFRLGLSESYLNYAYPVQSQSISTFEGKSGFLHSLYFQNKSENLSFATELSFDANMNFGMKSLVSLSGKKFEFYTLFRHFSGSFRSPFGYNYGESYAPSNEIGIYFGGHFKPDKKLELDSYIDVYKSHERTYSVPKPIWGIDALINTEFILESGKKFMFRVRMENKTDSYKTDDASEPIVSQINKASIRMELLTLIKRHELRLRFEHLWLFAQGRFINENGVTFMCDFRSKLSSWFNYGIRLNLFNTDSYHSGIWQFSYTLPGLMNNTAYYGSGSSIIIFCRISLIKQLDFWFRYNGMFKNEIESIGSSYDEILGSSKNNFVIQADFRI